MSTFNGYVKWSWCRTNGTPQVPVITNYRPHLEYSLSRRQRIPYETDHDYAAVSMPTSLDEASIHRQGVHRSKISSGRNSQYRREHKPYSKRSAIHMNLTTEQIISLEEVFQIKPHVTLEERITLAERLQIDVNAIKIWFRNRRQSTNRLEQHYAVPESPSSDEESDSNLDRLALIELRIKENTDIYGYVTLDDELMKNLVYVIDECLSKNVESESEKYNRRIETRSTNLSCYEPVSPVTLSEDSEDTAPWQNLDPEKNLERLMDIQAFLCRNTR